MKKIIGIIIMMLLIGTFIPVVNSSDQISNQILNDDGCGCYSNIDSGHGIISKNILEQKDYSIQIQNINGVPDYFNWKDFGGQDWTTTAKNQYMPKNCGSCWDFAAIGALESVINIREGSAIIDPDLSEQYVLSCLPDAAITPGEGCRGGDSLLAFELMMATTPEGNYHNGALLEECFPYKADDDISCDDKCPDWIDKLVPILTTEEWYPDGSPEQIELIKSQIIEIGPVVTGILATSDFDNWMRTHHDPDDYYPYYETNNINHVIVIVGWKDDPTIKNGGYWICKNSYGTDPGYDGFFNLEYESLSIATAINWVDYDPESYEWENEPNPPSETMITGESNGDIRTEYEYTFNAIDPEDRDVMYYISWGDGNWEWTDYHPSSEDVKLKHTYKKQGDYYIVALAMNTDSNIGSWGTLEISMPRNKFLNDFNLGLVRLIQRFPILESLL